MLDSLCRVDLGRFLGQNCGREYPARHRIRQAADQGQLGGFIRCVIIIILFFFPFIYRFYMIIYRTVAAFELSGGLLLPNSIA